MFLSVVPKIARRLAKNCKDAWIRFFRKKNPFSQYEYPIAFAFSAGGVDYYTFLDILKMPACRQVAAQAAMEQMKMGFRASDLEMYITEALNCFNQSPIPAGRIRDILKMIQDRQKVIIEVESVLNLAAVTYFSQDENPEFITEQQIEAKTKKWKAMKDLRGFFLKLPLSTICKVHGLQSASLVSYIQATLEIEVQQMLLMRDASSQRDLLSLRIRECQSLLQNLESISQN